MRWLTSALDRIDELRREYLSRSATYWRNGQAVSIAVTPARSRIAGMVMGDAVYEAELRDYIVATADLVLSGSAFLPAPGDVIEDDGQRWLVLPDRDAAWSPCDPAGRFIRIHTRRAPT